MGRYTTNIGTFYIAHNNEWNWLFFVIKFYLFISHVSGHLSKDSSNKKLHIFNIKQGHVGYKQKAGQRKKPLHMQH